jgi:predicted ester cyclase
VAHVPAATGPLDLEVLDAWRQFTATFVEAFPDLRLTVEDIFSEGDTVAARVAFRGTHRGEFQGIPPTDKEVAFSSIEIDRMVDGKVEEHWFEMDLLGLMGQLGAIPGPEQSEEANPT